MDEIRKELLELGFRPNSIGFFYWVDAILLVRNKDIPIGIGYIYNILAERYNSSYDGIDRVMRYSMKPAIENIKKKYNISGKCTNQTFLYMIILYLKEEN